MLKPHYVTHAEKSDLPAAFRRLCVETIKCAIFHTSLCPAAFRRLCVETICRKIATALLLPAAFRRLCVETCCACFRAAAVSQPPLGGCVLKHDYDLRCPFGYSASRL